MASQRSKPISGCELQIDCRAVLSHIRITALRRVTWSHLPLEPWLGFHWKVVVNLRKDELGLVPIVSFPTGSQAVRSML